VLTVNRYPYDCNCVTFGCCEAKYFFLAKFTSIFKAVTGGEMFSIDRLLARSQYSEGPATGHLDTGFSWFPCV